jgi:uncharacterized membrane protein
MSDDPLLRLAGELRELGTRMLTTADELIRHTSIPTIATAPPPLSGPTALPVDQPWPAEQDQAYLADDIPPPPLRDTPAHASPANMPSRREDGVWERWGVRSVAWTGGAVTLSGTVLLLILAIHRGWLGPVPRLALGVVVAGVLLGAAPRVRRTIGGSIGACALAGTGLAVGYLDVVTATTLYHYLPVPVGLLLGLGIAVGGVWLADRWDNWPLAVFVVLGAAVLAPWCTNGATPLLVGFLLVLAGAASPVQLRHDWPWLSAAAGLPPVIAALYLAATTRHLHEDVTATTVMAALTTVACLGVATVTVLRRPEDQLCLGLLALAPTPVMAAAPLLSRPVAAGLLAGLAALLLVGWLASRWWSWPPVRFGAVAGGAGAVVLGHATLVACSTTALAVTLLAESVVITLAAVWSGRQGTLLIAGLYAGAGVVDAMVRALPVLLLVRAPRGPVPVSALLDGAVTGGVLVLACLVGTVALLRLRAGTPPAVWIGVGLAGLYGSTGVVVCTALVFADDRGGFLVGQVLVTVCWAVSAYVLLLKGISRVSPRVAGLVLVGAAVAKLVLFDLAALDGLARVSAFLGTGIVLLVAGVRYAQLIGGRVDRRL